MNTTLPKHDEEIHVQLHAYMPLTGSSFSPECRGILKPSKLWMVSL